jgi:hypothetical protein
MLVLAAVYQSQLYTRYPDVLTHKLTKKTLSLLFTRTIKALSDVKYNSPILKVDVEILENVRKIIGID